MKKALALAVLTVSFLIFGIIPALAVDYPTRPITMVVVFTAGGPADAVARVLAPHLSAALKGQVIVENIVGAGGTVATARVAKSAPDGYTLLIHHIAHSTAPSLYRRLPYDPIRDFEPIGLIGANPMTLITRKDFPARNLRELLAYVKTHRAKINLAHAGIGSASHLCGLLFQSTIETDLTTVPFGGTGPAMMAILGGQVDIMCDQSSNTIPQIKAGTVNVFGITTRDKVPALADVPTLHEAGLPNFDVSVWYALYAPRGTPKAIIEKLNKALIVALRDPALRLRYADLGFEVFPEARINPDAARAHLKSEIDRWGAIIKKAGVFAD